MALTPKQRKHLKGLAHNLNPTVRVGRAGVTDAVASETSRTIEAHELMKVHVDADEAETRREMAGDLAGRTGSEVVGIIGKMAILYRPRAEKPSIRLPKD